MTEKLPNKVEEQQILDWALSETTPLLNDLIRDFVAGFHACEGQQREELGMVLSTETGVRFVRLYTGLIRRVLAMVPQGGDIGRYKAPFHPLWAGPGNQCGIADATGKRMFWVSEFATVEEIEEFAARLNARPQPQFTEDDREARAFMDTGFNDKNGFRIRGGDRVRGNVCDGIVVWYQEFGQWWLQPDGTRPSCPLHEQYKDLIVLTALNKEGEG